MNGLASRWRRLHIATACVVVFAIVAVTLVLLAGPIGDRMVVDSDGDGLPDTVETSGWRVADGRVFVTNPKRPDSDGDGLPDGVEAGARTVDRQLGAVYGGFSDPRLRDTDGDGIGDADEYFLDLSPSNADTDGDGADDAAELGCGSDPAEANPDGDSYTDQEECGRGSDPFAFNLTHGQATAALIGGVAFGDATWAAQHIGRLSGAQMESPEYLAGQIAGSFVGVSAIRDLIADLGRGDIVSALFSTTALIPLAGGAAATVVVITKFAKRGERAEQAAADVVQRAPWSKDLKEKVFTKIFGPSTRLPVELRGGPKDYSVYRSSLGSAEKYVGISDDPPRRWRQHAAAGRSFTPELIQGATGLTKGQARSIEEACIVRGGLRGAGGSLANEYHSINPDAPHHDAAVRYGNALLKKLGGACPA
jgi:hypothetical protein